MSKTMVVATLALICAIPHRVAAAEAGVDPDSLVRVQFLPREHRSTVSGRLVGQDQESVTIAFESLQPPLRIERSAIERIEIFRGRSHGRGAGKGALIGLGAGVLAGVALGAAADHTYTTAGSDVVGGGIVFGVLGTGLGAVIGGISGADRWESVDRGSVLSGNVKLSVVPMRHGVGTAVALRF
jgi:hypothetical protein